jgi:hypothetical protein
MSMRNALWCYLYQEKALFAVSNPHKKMRLRLKKATTAQEFDI